MIYDSDSDDEVINKTSKISFRSLDSSPSNNPTDYLVTTSSTTPLSTYTKKMIMNCINLPRHAIVFQSYQINFLIQR